MCQRQPAAGEIPTSFSAATTHEHSAAAESTASCHFSRRRRRILARLLRFHRLRRSRRAARSRLCRGLFSFRRFRTADRESRGKSKCQTQGDRAFHRNVSKKRVLEHPADRLWRASLRKIRSDFFSIIPAIPGNSESLDVLISLAEFPLSPASSAGRRVLRVNVHRPTLNCRLAFRCLLSGTRYVRRCRD